MLSLAAFKDLVNHIDQNYGAILRRLDRQLGLGEGIIDATLANKALLNLRKLGTTTGKTST